VRAYKRETGEVFWTSGPTEERVMGDLVVIGSDVVTTTLSENQLVVAFNLTTGGKSWTVKKPGADDFNKLLTVTPAPK
jgi:outer membrane protein assembly factor BamB